MGGTSQGPLHTGQGRVWDVEDARPKRMSRLPAWPVAPSTVPRGASECGSLWAELEGWSFGQVGETARVQRPKGRGNLVWGQLDRSEETRALSASLCKSSKGHELWTQTSLPCLPAPSPEWTYD